MASANRNRRRTQTSIQTGDLADQRVLTKRQSVQDLWWLAFGGCLTFLAFPYRTTPDSEIWPLAWIALVPLLSRLRAVSGKRAFSYGAFYGLVVNFGGFWWMSGMFEEFGHLPTAVAWGLTFLNAAYQGLMFALFAWLAVWLGRKEGRLPGPFVLASAFTAIEYLYPMVFPWYFGNSQHPFRWFVQVADLGGVYLVSFLVVLFNSVALGALERLSRRPVYWVQSFVALVLLLVALAYGFLRLGEVDETMSAAPTLRIGMVEADIGIWEKEAKGLDRRQRALTLHANLLKHQEMSRELARQGAELILWPESSYIPLGPVYGKRLDSFALGIGKGGRMALWRDLGERGFDWSLGPIMTSAGTAFRDVAASREDNVFAVGDMGAVIHWDGTRVVPVPIQVLEGETAPALFGVAVGAPKGKLPEGDGVPPLVWAVGQHGYVYTGDRLGLDLVATNIKTSLRAVTMVRGGRGIAVGDAGVILALEGRSYRQLPTVTDNDLLAVTHAPDNDAVWAVGVRGTVLSTRSGAWAPEKVSVEATLRSVTTTPSGEVYAVGDHGTIIRRSGRGQWTQEAIATKAHLDSVCVDARGVVLIADRVGSLWRRASDGSARWERLDTPGIGPLQALTSLDYVRMRPIPRDARYIFQDPLPGPSAEEHKRNPRPEQNTSKARRTAVQRGFTTPVLFGAITWETHFDDTEPSRRVWNTAVLLDEMGRIKGMYDKYQLLAFGEYIPFGEWFPDLYKLIPEAGRFTAGDDVGAFKFGDHKLGLMVCYEDILTRFAARLAGLEPHVLLNITNDAWFGRTSEPYLHMNLAVMRAIETHRPLLRSTNTGISTIIDPAGRITHQTSIDDAETLISDVPMMSVPTLYARVGDLFAHMTLLHMLLLGYTRRTRR